MAEYNKPAPVFIPTLNRHTHLKRCVESLLACSNSDQTELIIVLDYPLVEKHWAGYNKICTYLDSIKGFQKVSIIKRKTNLGAVNNFFESLNEIFLLHDRVIFSEDDNLFSPDFLNFVNKGLNTYEGRPDIFSVSGYHFPISLPDEYDNDVYLWQGFSAWGVGLWKEKWEKMINYIPELIKLVKKGDSSLVRIGLPKTATGLKNMVLDGTILGDLTASYYQFVNNMYSVFPTISRVRNSGHDGTGIHGGNNPKVRNLYLNQQVSSSLREVVMPFNLKPDPSIETTLKNHFKPKMVIRLKMFLKYLLKRARTSLTQHKKPKK